MALLIDHTKHFTDRAVELSKNFKMDFAMVRDIQDRAITLGDIVAHSVPLNSFGQILDHFEMLLGKPLRPLLITVEDRWRTEVEKQPPKPIIPDFDALKKRLSRLFEIRHVLCHELPQSPVYSVDEVSDFLKDAVRFAHAIEEILTFEKYGLVPLTQSEMNKDASEKLKGRQQELDGLLISIRSYLGSRHQTLREFSLGEVDCLLSRFDDTQEKWLAFRKANCDFAAEVYHGGTIMPLIWASTAENMTESRIAELQTWFDRESNL